MNADQEPRKPSGAADGPDSNRDRSEARPDETELSDRLAAIANHQVPVPDWSDVVHRADSPPAIPLRPTVTTAGRRPLGRTAMAVAAALIVVVGAVGVYVTTRNDDGDPLETGPAGPDDAEVIDTGWYIPSPLPDGWEVTSIETSTMTLVGPGTLAVWAAPDGSASLTYASEPLDGGIPTGGPGIQLTGEIRGHYLGDSGIYPGAVSWEHDDLLHLVIGNGLEVDEVKHAARQMAAYPGRTDSPIEGLTLVDRSRRTYENREVTDVKLGLRTPEGREVHFELTVPEGMGRSTLVGMVPVRQRMEGQPLEVIKLNETPVVEDGPAGYLGIWPGADVSVPLSNHSYVLGDTDYLPTNSDLAALLRSLRPATAEQWRSFLRGTGLEEDERLLTAEHLADLDEHPGQEPSGPSTETPVVVPDPGLPANVEDWPEETAALFDDMVVPWRMAGPTVVDSVMPSGTAVTLHWSFGHGGPEALEINECTIAGTTLVLVPRGSREPVARPDITGCDPERTDLVIPPTEHSFEPEDMTSWPMPPRFEDGVPTREVRSGPDGAHLGGTLPPGRYDLVYDLRFRGGAGFSGRQAVALEPHPCGGFTTEFVDRYVFKTVDEAEAQAAGEGTTVRIVEVDGVAQSVTDDHRCDRVNLSVRDDRVAEVVDVG